MEIFPEASDALKLYNNMKKIFILLLIILLILIIFSFVRFRAGKENKSINQTLAGTGQQEIILSDNRTFYLKTPAINPPYPVIIAIHGRGQSAQAFLSKEKGTETFPHERQGQFTEDALAAGYAVLIPDSGIPFCGKDGAKQWHYSENSEDVKFFGEIFDYIQNNPQLNGNRVYVAGISSGGFMTSRLAMRFSDKIKAVYINSAGDADMSEQYETKGILKCNSTVTFDKSVPIVPKNHPKALIIHGDADGLVPFEMDELYAQGLQNAGVEHEFIAVPGGTHTWFVEYNNKILDWFK